MCSSDLSLGHLSPLKNTFASNPKIALRTYGRLALTWLTKLFEAFARFEYALKAAGFHDGEGAAEVNWREFVASGSAHNRIQLDNQAAA